MIASVYHTTSPEQTMELGMQLASRLKPGMPVLLFGDLGSGKTHFTKGIAKGLGINEIIKSPTFAYVNTYKCEVRGAMYDVTLHHYDLYRLQSGEATDSIGLEDSLNHPHALNVIEWADRLAHLPKDHIRVNFKAKENHHEITIRFHDSQAVAKDAVQRYWDQWTTPMHVRAHCEKVAEVALQIGRALVGQQILLDLNLIYTAALLHDLCRVCDFNEMDRAYFSEPITEEKWDTWLQQREQFKGMHHADIACGALLEDGYNKSAEVIRLHNSLRILEEPEKYSILEVALVYYADKRVKHDQVVDLDERFRDGRLRNSKNDPKLEAQFTLAQEKKRELERQLFDLIDLEPEDVK